MLHLRWIVSRSRGQARLHCGINACEIVSAEVQIKGCERLLEMIAAASADKRDDIQSTRPDPCNCELTRASPSFISNQAQLIYQSSDFVRGCLAGIEACEQRECHLWYLQPVPARSVSRATTRHMQ